MKCGANYHQMFGERERERERGSETFVTKIQFQLFTEKSSKRERNILAIKAEAPGRMTEKTEGGGERQEAGRREAAQPPPLAGKSGSGHSRQGKSLAVTGWGTAAAFWCGC